MLFNLKVLLVRKLARLECNIIIIILFCVLYQKTIFTTLRFNIYFIIIVFVNADRIDTVVVFTVKLKLKNQKKNSNIKYLSITYSTHTIYSHVLYNTHFYVYFLNVFWIRIQIHFKSIYKYFWILLLLFNTGKYQNV